MLQCWAYSVLQPVIRSEFSSVALCQGSWLLVETVTVVGNKSVALQEQSSPSHSLFNCQWTFCILIADIWYTHTHTNIRIIFCLKRRNYAMSSPACHSALHELKFTMHPSVVCTYMFFLSQHSLLASSIQMVVIKINYLWAWVNKVVALSLSGIKLNRHLHTSTHMRTNKQKMWEKNMQYRHNKQSLKRRGALRQRTKNFSVQVFNL